MYYVSVFICVEFSFLLVFVFFFFKQKTAYEMRISDWSSDVCSSDLPRSFDVWALDQVAALVAEAREINEGLRAVAVLNGADAQGADNEAALEMIGDIEGIEVLPTSIVRRKAFPNAAAEGRAVGEQSPRDA